MTVYNLRWDYDHLLDMTYDIALLNFNELEKKELRRNIKNNTFLKIEKTLEFLGNFNTLITQTDFPVSEKSYPIFSKKMVEILENIGSYSFNLFPILIQDDTYLNIGSRYDDKGILKPEIKVREDFFLLQPTNIIKAIHFEKSEYKPARENQKYPSIFYKLVLQEPKGGFPPIFRLIQNTADLYINEETKNAFEKANIKGCRFIPIEVIPHSSA